MHWHTEWKYTLKLQAHGQYAVLISAISKQEAAMMFGVGLNNIDGRSLQTAIAKAFVFVSVECFCMRYISWKQLSGRRGVTPPPCCTKINTWLSAILFPMFALSCKPDREHVRWGFCVFNRFKCWKQLDSDSLMAYWQMFYPQFSYRSFCLTF